MNHVFTAFFVHDQVRLVLDLQVCLIEHDPLNERTHQLTQPFRVSGFADGAGQQFGRRGKLALAQVKRRNRLVVDGDNLFFKSLGPRVQLPQPVGQIAKVWHVDPVRFQQLIDLAATGYGVAQLTCNCRAAAILIFCPAALQLGQVPDDRHDLLRCQDTIQDGIHHPVVELFCRYPAVLAATTFLRATAVVVVVYPAASGRGLGLHRGAAFTAAQYPRERKMAVWAASTFNRSPLSPQLTGPDQLRLRNDRGMGWCHDPFAFRPVIAIVPNTVEHDKTGVDPVGYDCTDGGLGPCGATTSMPSRIQVDRDCLGAEPAQVQAENLAHDGRFMLNDGQPLASTVLGIRDSCISKGRVYFSHIQFCAEALMHRNWRMYSASGNWLCISSTNASFKIPSLMLRFTSTGGRM
nr:hypothetical protein [Laribacter hongkongensis]